MIVTGLGLLRLMRPRNAYGALVAYAVGYAALTSRPDLRAFTIPLTIILLMNGVATIQNDLVDEAIDKLNKRSSCLLDGSCSPSIVRRFSLLLLILACLIGVRSSQPKLNLGFILASLLLAAAYNLKPVIASRRPASSIAVLGLCTGFLPIMYGAAISGQAITLPILGLAVSWFCQRASLNLMKDFKDIIGDAQSSKHTFLIRYGKKQTLRFSLLLTVVGFVVLGLSLYSRDAIIFLVLIPLAIGIIIHRYRLLNRRTNAQSQAGFVEAIILQNAFDSGALLCLLI